MIRPRHGFLLGAVFSVASCISGDDTPGLGSVEFTFGVTSSTSAPRSASLVTSDDFEVRFDRVVLGFKTMTIGRKGAPDLCEYRGRGAATNLVVVPSFGGVQSFNGIRPVECPDVGIIFGPPDGATTLGPGATVADLVDLAAPAPIQALVDLTLTPLSERAPLTQQPVKVELRFDERASTRFAGCSTLGTPALGIVGFTNGTTPGAAPVQGVRVVAGARDEVSVRFAGESLFVETLTPQGATRAMPFVLADVAVTGNGDRIVTMNELDKLPLAALGAPGETYELYDGTRKGSFGDFVRALFGLTMRFRTESGLCLGIAPGTPEER